MLAVSMPNSATLAPLVETATKCLATAAASPRCSTSQARALRALVMVSSVVKVLEQTMNSVSAAIQIAHGLGELGAVHIGHEAET